MPTACRLSQHRKIRPFSRLWSYRWTDDLKEIPYYRYGDSQQAFFDSWEESQAPFAIIEGSAATFLIPVCDMDNILNSSYGNKKEVYRFQTLDEMLDWYAAFVKQYDAYSGLDYECGRSVESGYPGEIFHQGKCPWGRAGLLYNRPQCL